MYKHQLIQKTIQPGVFQHLKKNRFPITELYELLMQKKYNALN